MFGSGGSARLVLAVCAACLLTGAGGGCSAPSKGVSETTQTTGRQAGTNDSLEARMPDQPPDLRARVVSVERGESTTAASDAVPAGVLVEGEPSQEPTAAGQGTDTESG